MEEFIKKISSYNIFNYLLPGTLFAYIFSAGSNLNLVQDDLLFGIFLYYFIGLTISRVGSLIIEPLLKGVKFLKFSEYKDFVIASRNDTQLDVLSEGNNMYRTFISLFSILGVLKFYAYLISLLPWLKDMSSTIIFFLLFILFLFSYRKQTEFIRKRVEANIK